MQTGIKKSTSESEISIAHSNMCIKIIASIQFNKKKGYKLIL